MTMTVTSSACIAPCANVLTLSVYSLDDFAGFHYGGLFDLRLHSLIAKLMACHEFERLRHTVAEDYDEIPAIELYRFLFVSCSFEEAYRGPPLSRRLTPVRPTRNGALYPALQ